ncbi:MAG: hypothetical protein KMY54_09250, partial [Erysipelothrix sp.]|nr:hypothetical protein [Erysipelothrix sp.]
MRKWMIGIIIAVLTLVGGGYVYSSYISVDFCRVDGETICYDLDTKIFKVEERSKITVALPSKGMLDWSKNQSSI